METDSKEASEVQGQLEEMTPQAHPEVKATCIVPIC